MIPATAAKSTPNTTSLKNLYRIKYPIIAPSGSDKPERNESLNAFFLLLWQIDGDSDCNPLECYGSPTATAMALPTRGPYGRCKCCKPLGSVYSYCQSCKLFHPHQLAVGQAELFISSPCALLLRVFPGGHESIQ